MMLGGTLNFIAAIPIVYPMSYVRVSADHGFLLFEVFFALRGEKRTFKRKKIPRCRNAELAEGQARITLA
jgi:hypothetical protein